MKNIDDPQTGQPKGYRIGFNIFMMFVYIIVGVLFFTGFFNIDNKPISYTVGGLLVAYGIWRGVRVYINEKTGSHVDAKEIHATGGSIVAGSNPGDTCHRLRPDKER